MKYETFENLLLNAKSLYDTAVKKDKAIEEAFGGDSLINTEWWSPFIEETISIIESEYNDKTGSVDWLFWEIICSPSNIDFTFDDAIYEGSILNIWLQLEGKLDERYSKGFVEANEQENKPKTVPELGKKNESVIAHKLIRLKDKQIASESTALLSNSVFDDSVSLESFEELLDKSYNQLKTKSDNQEIITEISGNIKIALMILRGSTINQETMNMAEFEISKVLYNHKEQGRIKDYRTIESSSTIYSSIFWKNDARSDFVVELGDDININFI